MLERDIEITPMKINWFYRLRPERVGSDKVNQCPTEREKLLIYRKHSDKYGIAGRGTITIKDFT